MKRFIRLLSFMMAVSLVLSMLCISAAAIQPENSKKVPTAADFVCTLPSGAVVSDDGNTATLTWDGKDHGAIVTTAEGVTGMGSYRTYYKKDGSAAVSDLPSNAGDYTVYVDVSEGDNYQAASGDQNRIVLNKTIKITQAPQPYLAVTVDGRPVADGKAEAEAGSTIQVQVSNGIGSGLYRLEISRQKETPVLEPSEATHINSQNGRFALGALTTGKFKLIIIKQGDGNTLATTDGTSVYFMLIVKPRILTADDFTFTDPDKTYDGSPISQVPVALKNLNPAYTGAVTVYYTKEGGSPTTELPADAGTYTVSVNCAADENYAATESGSLLTDSSWTFTIKKAEQQAALTLAVDGGSDIIASTSEKQIVLNGNGTAKTFTVTLGGGSGTGDYTLTVTDGTGSATVTSATVSNGVFTVTPVEKGTITLTAGRAGDDKYKGKTVSGTGLTLTSVKVTPPVVLSYVKEYRKEPYTLAGAIGLLDGFNAATMILAERQTEYVNAGMYTALLSLKDSNLCDWAGAPPDDSDRTVTLQIKPKPVTVSGITAVDKDYDGTTDVTLNTTGAAFAGMLEGDTLTVAATGAFAGADAGTDKTVNISGLTLSGTDVGNYTLAESGQQKSAKAKISKAAPAVTAPAAKGLTYSGSAQELIEEGSTKDGTISYAVTTTKAAPAAEAFREVIPSGTDTGTYYVWYKVTGDDNHKDTEPVSITVSILPMDRDNLNSLIGEAEDYPETIGEKYPDIAGELEAAISEAKETAENPNARAEEIAEQIRKLTEGLEKAKKAVKDAENQAAAKAVKDLIDALPDADKVTIDDKDAIEAARKAYNALTEDQKKLIGAETLKKLEDAEAALNRRSITYTVTEGEDTEYRHGSDGTLTFVFKRSEADDETYRFFSEAKYDGRALTRDRDYRAKAGSMIITLEHSLLESMMVGNHTLTAVFDDGEADAHFTVIASAEPTATPAETPTATPTVTPTATPTVTPTAALTATPTVTPTATPTVTPTATPTVTPTAAPTATPTVTPTETPTVTPTAAPTATPTPNPTPKPIPKTGDNSNPALWLALMILGLTVLGGMAVKGYRKR